MPDLTARYLGLELKNPVIAASSGLTGRLDSIKQLADAGVGAVVLKSMFEELIVAETEQLDNEMIQNEHPEAYEYMRAELGMQIGPKPYLKFIEDVKSTVDCPVIGSINCVSSKWWAPYARDIELAGADALELNISHFPGNDDGSDSIEKTYIDAVHNVMSEVSIPVAVKLNFYFTSIAKIAQDLAMTGVAGLVLFNRLYSVDIDVSQQKIVPGMTLSSKCEMALPLRWIGTLYGFVNCDFAATSGIHDSESIIKMILAGASAVQLCSVLYQNGPEHVGVLLKEIEDWLVENDCSELMGLRGMALSNTENKQSLFKRIQYVKSLENAAKNGI